jgi:hypothetical protein
VEKVQGISKEKVGLRTAQQDDDDLQFDRVKLVGSNRKLSVSIMLPYCFMFAFDILHLS